MKFRKEFLVFGGVLVVILVVVILTQLFGGKSYKNFNKIDDDTSQAGVVSTDTSNAPVYDKPIGDTTQSNTGEPSRSDNDIGSQDTDVSSQVTEPSSGDTSAGQEQPGDTSSATEQPPEETELPNGDIDENDGDYRGQVLQTNEYAYMLMDYVCGIDNELFVSWLTPELFAEFRTHENVEPYIHLVGNDYFANMSMEDGKFSFSVEDGTSYSFEYTLSEGKVSSISFVQ